MRPRGWRIGGWMLAVVLVTTACAAGDTDAPAATDPTVDDAAPDDVPSDDTPDTTRDDDADSTSDDDAGADGVEPDDPTDDVAAEPDEPPYDGPLGFSARSLEGGTVDVATFAAGPVALWMWTPW